MSPNTREQARIERRLIACLTEACEQAKGEIPGFEWLTHEVDYGKFPASLRVIWVFDTEASKAQMVAAGQQHRIGALTAQALADADIALTNSDRLLRFDSEEECNRRHAGDWRVRIAQLHAAKGAR